MKHPVIVYLVLSTILLVMLPLTVFSRGPNMINYQASVTDDLGNPISDEAHTITFTLYFHPTDPPSFWSETASITTAGGSFSHHLGSVDPVGNPLPEGLFTSGDSLWLEITIDGEILAPRTRLVSVGNALAVQTIDQADGGMVYGDVTVAGKVGIGTTTPGGKLHVESQEDPAGFFTSDYYSYSSTVLKAEYTGTASGWGDSMITAVVGISNPADAAGTGGSFIGGYKGVEGSVWQTGNDEYYGVSGFVHADEGYGTKYGVKGQVVTWGSGSSGRHYGVLGDAYGGLVSYGVKGIAMAADTSYGVFGQAYGSGVNYAGYFKGDYYSPNSTVLKAEYTGTAGGWGDSMITAVVGISNPADAAGIGGSFIGGYKGVEGSVWQTGNDEYYGVSGFVHADEGYGTKYGVKGQVVTYGSGSSGRHYGVLGDAYGGLVSYGVKGIAMAADTSYGVFGQAYGSGVNYAGYFKGDYYSPNSTVLKAEYTGTAGGWGDSMITAIVGISNPADAAGIGGSFIGGYKGVEGSVWQTGNDEYYGVSGFVHADAGSGTKYGVKGQVVTWGSGSSGHHYGVLGDAYGGLVSYGVKGIAAAADTNYAVFGQVYGSGVKYAGYFKGDVHSEGTISCNLTGDSFMPSLRGLDITVTNTDAGAVGGKFRVESDGFGEHYGLYSEAVGATGSDSSAFGIYAQANTENTYQSSYGVLGYSYAQGDYADAYGGVFDGVTTNSAGAAYGCLGNGWNNSDGTVYGGYFYAGGNTGTGTHYGVYAGVSGSGTSYAGYFNGDVHITGTLTGGKNGIKIDHPLDPENKYLHHSSVTSPDMMNIYNGNVILDGGGEAVVALPDYFEALNMDFRYQLTCLGGFAPVYVAEEISDNRFVIAGGEPGMKISWQVTGIRKDAYAETNQAQVEEAKPDGERGKYLYPGAIGLGEEYGMSHKQNQTNHYINAERSR